MRKPEAVAEEIAALHHERGAQVIFIQDDLFVLPSEARTIERTERLGEALRSRGVTDLVFWVKGRPETITPAVAQALKRMGVIHLFLGIESANAERLEYLGRTHQPSDNDAAIAACRAAGSCSAGACTRRLGAAARSRNASVAQHRQPVEAPEPRTEHRRRGGPRRRSAKGADPL